MHLKKLFAAALLLTSMAHPQSRSADTLIIRDGGLRHFARSLVEARRGV